MAKPVDVKTEITILAPIEKVAAFAANPANAPAWYVNIKSAEWRTDPGIKVGGQIAFKAKFLGRELAYVYEIKEYIPNKKMVMRTSDGPFPMETTYTWEATPGGTTFMTLRNAGQPSGFSGIFAPMMAGAMRRANTKDLKKLKEIMEKKGDA